MMRFFIIAILFPFVMCAQDTKPFVMVLGIAQDGGYPHLGCEKECCSAAWKNDSLKKNVVALALVDPANKKWWLFEATPDITKQLHLFQTLTKGEYKYLPEGVFLTHAHIGHYTGLMEFGREVFNTKEIPVYALPKMKLFLEQNGPWSQLVKLKNISLHELDTTKVLTLGDGIQIQSFTVPHRDEFSETAGFKIITKGKSYLFIPDIDKWEKWSRSINEEVKNVDVAFLDATFNDSNELQGRNIKEVPHPLVSETCERFKKETESTRAKIVFIHFNHTNKLMRDNIAQEEVKKLRFNLAEQGNRY